MAKFKVSGHDDTERKNFMYSPFPANKNINPRHWDTKLQFWSNEIIRCCRFHEVLCITREKLNEHFQDDNKRTPSGLLVVLESLYESGQTVLKTSVCNISPEETWAQWGYSFAAKSASWVWRKYVTGFNDQTEFIIKELLEEYSLALLDCHYKNVKYEKTDNVVPWNVLKSVYKINNKLINEENLICIVGHLKNIRKCKIGIMNNNEKVVKFKAKNQNKVDPVNKLDFEIIKLCEKFNKFIQGIFVRCVNSTKYGDLRNDVFSPNLKKSIAKISMECQRMELECKQLREDAQNIARSNEKQKAKRILIQRQRLQKTLTLKQDALMSMKEHLRAVQEAETTKIITNAFNSSATLLNQTFKEDGLNVETIENVMDKVAEANLMVNEVNDALTDGLKQLEEQEFDMDELENELEELEVNSSFIQEEQLTSQLPEAPSHLPFSSTPSTETKEKRENKLPMKQQQAFAV